jgi:hypothetical protein
MTNSFVEFYYGWFDRYGAKKQPYATEAKKIATVLAKNHNLERLSREISKILATIPLTREYSVVEETPSFFKITTKLNTDISARESLKLDEFIAQAQARKTSNHAINQLLSFLIETLRHPDFRMHSRTLALTSTLVHLDDIIDHLETLAPVARSSTAPRPGSFDAEAIRSEEHSGCIDLIRANSAVYDEKNTSWMATNDLLQELLIINRDLTTEPLSEPSKCLLQ